MEVSDGRLADHCYLDVCRSGCCGEGDGYMIANKNWLKKIWCWLTGGHTFADINLVSEHLDGFGKTAFINWCTKCGECKCYVVDDKALYYDGEPLYKQFNDWGMKDGK